MYVLIISSVTFPDVAQTYPLARNVSPITLFDSGNSSNSFDAVRPLILLIISRVAKLKNVDGILDFYHAAQNVYK